jgi:3-isopropylmalate/(R)-2-methylmalate dehydratase small subunit
VEIVGKAWKYGDNINTDYIIPGRYMELTDPNEMKKHVFEEYDPNFRNRIEEGDIVVGGENFGCGSSREHAPLALKYIGIKCVIAESFARIFYRNCINIGLPALECPEVKEKVNSGDKLQINIENGTIINKTNEKQLVFKPLPDFMVEVLKAGGLAPYLYKVEEW